MAAPVFHTRAGRFFRRMLKKPASVVQTLNVPQRVRFGLSLAAALLDSLFEHPASMFASRIGSFTQKILIPLRTRRLPHRQRPTTDRSHKYNTPLARSVRLRGEFARKVKKNRSGGGSREFLCLLWRSWRGFRLPAPLSRPAHHPYA